MTPIREELELLEEELFRRLMGVVAQEEGKLLIEEIERLRLDDSCSIPAALDQKCRNIIMEAFRNTNAARPQTLRQ